MWGYLPPPGTPEEARRQERTLVIANVSAAVACIVIPMGLFWWFA